MKKQFPLLVLPVLIFAAISFTAFLPQENENNKKQKTVQHQGHKKDKAAKTNNGSQDIPQDDKERMKDKKDKKAEDDVVRDDQNEHKDIKKDGHKWDRETFKNRDQLKNKEKVTICHKYNHKNNKGGVTISVSQNALKAHMKHGDIMGACPQVRDSRYSSGFIEKQNDYYNRLQESQEQVLYSKSILEYAQERLNVSRSQLAVLQKSNTSPVEIERKQATVVELEENVSLLEILINEAANLLADKI